MTIETEDYRATPAVWRKRIFQLPTFAFNPRQWTFGISWAAPEDCGDFCLHIGPVGLLWDMWP